jgi:DNA-binding transcriptional MerR regulator
VATVNIAGMELKLDELAQRTGVSPRTVRYYIAQGLLPSPGRLGPMTRYGREHVDRLRLIKQLQEERLSLAEIRSRLEGEPIPAVAVAESPPLPLRPSPVAAPDSIAPRQAPSEPALWERIVVTPDVELHVRTSVRHRSRRVERLIESARDLRDQP